MKRTNQNKIILWGLISVFLIPIVMIIDLLIKSAFEKNVVHLTITLAIVIAISLFDLINKLYKSG